MIRCAGNTPTGSSQFTPRTNVEEEPKHRCSELALPRPSTSRVGAADFFTILRPLVQQMHDSVDIQSASGNDPWNISNLLCRQILEPGIMEAYYLVPVAFDETGGNPTMRIYHHIFRHEM